MEMLKKKIFGIGAATMLVFISIASGSSLGNQDTINGNGIYNSDTCNIIVEIKPIGHGYKTENDNENLNIRSNSELSNLTEEMLLSSFIDKCKNISKEEFKLKFGTVLKSMLYLFRSEYRNLGKFSSGNQFDKLNNNTSEDYQKFKIIYEKCMKLLHFLNFNNFSSFYNQINPVTLSPLFIYAIFLGFGTFIGGGIISRSIMGGILLGIAVSTLFFIGPYAYFWATCMLAATYTAQSASLAVYCLDNQTKLPITNAKITATNREDTEDPPTFGTFNLYHNKTNPGWYYTTPQMLTDKVPPPGYWEITIRCEGFKDNTIYTENIPRSSVFANITYLERIH
jgi:hypothetical protein